eukprot:scaffold75_cov217-Pinguiococcus_pyrenoidosus.AAC.12
MERRCKDERTQMNKGMVVYFSPGRTTFSQATPAKPRAISTASSCLSFTILDLSFCLVGSAMFLRVSLRRLRRSLCRLWYQLITDCRRTKQRGTCGQNCIHEYENLKQNGKIKFSIFEISTGTRGGSNCILHAKKSSGDPSVVVSVAK